MGRSFHDARRAGHAEVTTVSPAGGRTLRGRLGCVLICLFPVVGSAQGILPVEYAGRRTALMDRVPNGVILLHAETGEKPLSQPSYLQNSTFLYFTGEAELPNAVLALDGIAREVRLFVPPAPTAFWFSVEGIVPEPGARSAARLGVTAVQPWDSLVPYLHRRIAAGVTTLYVDEARWPEALGTPSGLDPVAGSRELWRRSLARAFPGATIASVAKEIREMRFVKSPAEVAILRDNARATAQALLSGLPMFRPGARQRLAEARIAMGCVEAGAVGPSFWPWTMTGPNAHVRALAGSVYSYTQLDRTMQAGELVRVDIGCTNHNYGSDVGRTVPVSGTFSAAQREIWDLLIDAYRAGLAHLRAGVAIADVLATSREQILRRQPGLKTPQARQAAELLLGPKGMSDWSIHSVGIDSGESSLPVLSAGAVIAFEPIFSVGDDAFYLEDTILVTERGHEVLSSGLPYTADEIERAMRTRK
ncbi:MAG: aminopeptidase P N-terminal domain-containing protein [Gemmatimonadaceae bacterium]